MSKSLGNTIAPDKVIKQMGAEIIRLWVTTVDTSADVRVSMESFKQTSETYRKIRNTMRFMLANTADYDPNTNRVAYDELTSVDKYMEARLNQVLATSLAAYEKYDFVTVQKTVVSFLVNDLSAFYLDFAKDVIYIDAKDDHQRRAMQTVMYDTLVTLTKLLTPIMPHTTEEIWSYLHEPESYVQLAEMPEVTNHEDDDTLLAIWGNFMDLRDKVLKALEVARDQKIIGKSMEAAVTIYASEPVKDLLTELDANIMQLLIVSDLHIADLKDAPSDAMQFDDVAIKVVHAPGEVCPRCRMLKTDIGTDKRFPQLCARCAAIVANDYPQAITEGLEK